MAAILHSLDPGDLSAIAHRERQHSPPAPARDVRRPAPRDEIK